MIMDEARMAVLVIAHHGKAARNDFDQKALILHPQKITSPWPAKNGLAPIAITEAAQARHQAWPAVVAEVRRTLHTNRVVEVLHPDQEVLMAVNKIK